MMEREVQVLGVYLDSLYCNVYGEIDSEVYANLGELKQSLHDEEEKYRALVKRVQSDESAQGDDNELDEAERELLGRGRVTDFGRIEFGEIAGLPGGTLYLQARGSRHYPFVLRNNCVYVEITTRPNLPSIRVEYLAHALYGYSWQKLGDIPRAIALHFGILEPRVQVSRADIAADFQPLQEWRPPDMQEVVTLAKHRAVYYEGPEITSITIGRSKGGLQVQLYDKRKEMLHSGKGWMEEVWKESSPSYDASAPVWRLELRVYRRLLQCFEDAQGHGIETIEDLQHSLGDIVALAFDSRELGDRETKGWLRVVDPDNDSNTSRAPLAGWFALVTKSMSWGLCKIGRAKRRVAKCVASLDQSVRQLYRAAIRCEAVARAEGHSAASEPEALFSWVAKNLGEYVPLEGWASAVSRKMEELNLSSSGASC